MDKFLSYDTEKINMILNILNQVSWKGLEQVQAIAQVSAILGNPENNNNDKNKMDGDK
jgi:hypothetical protein